jgi:hypothetical protein
MFSNMFLFGEILQELMQKMEEGIDCHDFYISLQTGKENKLINEREKRKNYGENFSDVDELEKGTKKDNTQ